MRQALVTQFSLKSEHFIPEMFSEGDTSKNITPVTLTYLDAHAMLEAIEESTSSYTDEAQAYRTLLTILLPMVNKHDFVHEVNEQWDFDSGETPFDGGANFEDFIRHHKKIGSVTCTFINDSDDKKVVFDATEYFEACRLDGSIDEIIKQLASNDYCCCGASDDIAYWYEKHDRGSDISLAMTTTEGFVLTVDGDELRIWCATSLENNDNG